jgi:RNA polymerase sigma-70 factor (ECF subfamily)
MNIPHVFRPSGVLICQTAYRFTLTSRKTLPVDDLALLRKTAARDHGAFKSLVTRYQQQVLRVCHRMLGRHQDAEDAAQDVFLNVYRHAGAFQGQSKVSTWIYRIAVNTSLNHLRKRRRDVLMDDSPRPYEQQRMDEDRLATDDRERPDARFEAGERGRLLAGALDKLPEQQRTALILHKSEGLSCAEVAEVLEKSLSSVESLIHRARRNLRKRLAEKLKKS